MSIGFGVYAPSGFATDPEAVARGVAFLRSRGDRVVVDPGALGRVQRFAGSDDARAAAVLRMAAHPEVDVAIAVRGGYGWTRLLERLDYRALARSGTRWLGHSDFTAFALAMLAREGAVTYAGPMLGYDFGAEEPSPFTLEHCFGVLEHRMHRAEFALEGPDVEVEGTLWGGNLAMVASLVGTPYFPQLEGGLLFLEDVGEHPYRVERMLYQLHLAGVLARQRAVLLGGFTEYALNANDAGYDLAAAIAQLRAVCAVPVLSGLPFGHVRDKLTLPVGGHASLAVKAGAARLDFGGYRR